MKKSPRNRVMTGVCVALTSILIPFAASSTPASAAPERVVAVQPSALVRAEASGVVAVHNGRLGYQEIVIGKSSTRRIASSSFWNLSSTLATITARTSANSRPPMIATDCAPVRSRSCQNW